MVRHRPAVTCTPAADRALHRRERRRADHALRRDVRCTLEQLAADPRHRALRTHRHHALPGHLRTLVYGSRVSTRSGWRIHWTWTGADTIEVVRIGPHP